MSASHLSLTPNAVAALLGLPDRQVRKEAEHGILPHATPPRIDFGSLVYLRIVGLIGLELGVDGRRELHRLLARAAREDPVPETVEWLPLLTLKVGPVIRELTDRIVAFERWESTLVTRADMLGGETAFPKSRLAVRRIGGLVERGLSSEAIREDYPYLSHDDVHFAHVYTRAYPKLGRPRR